jgi:hypothetical protein
MSAYRVIGPGETLIWNVDWDAEDWLGTATISSSSWTISPTGPVLSGQINDSTTTQTKISGCTYGVQYTLRNTVTASDGQVGVRDIQLRCTDSP